MGTNVLLGKIEKQIEERYQKEKAALEVLKQSLAQNGNSSISTGSGLIPSKLGYTQTEIESACQDVIGGLEEKGGYYRLSEVVDRLRNKGLGLGVEARKFKRDVRVALAQLAKQGKIRMKTRKGRAGTTYLSKQIATKTN